jgi:Fuc2NAc and GlcNAc transferase
MYILHPLVAVTFLLSFLFSTFFVRLWFLKMRARGLLDVPNHRSSHTIPTPRAGAVGVVGGLFLGIFFWELSQYFRNWFAVDVSVPVLLENLSLISPGVPDFTVLSFGFMGFGLFLIGLLDDLMGLSKRIRFLSQFIAGGLAILVLVSGKQNQANWTNLPVISGLGLFGSEISGIFLFLFYCLILFWIVGNCNVFNFMDGVNGIAGLQMILLCLGFLLVSGAMPLNQPASLLFRDGTVLPEVEPFAKSSFFLILFGANVLGFLVWNFPGAKVFLGDSGSSLFGFVYACFSVYYFLYESISPVALILLNSLFLWDSGLTILVRFLNGEKITEPHKKHLYQILARRFGSHTKVTLFYLGMNLFLILPLALYIRYSAIPVTTAVFYYLFVFGIFAIFYFLVLRFKNPEITTR